ncbi:ABC transporter ATP-binding protein [Verminephrobacter eiseniae]|uniref:ABC transporter related n=1 Tax=Verminephrobacter eiseniae (strain EF01-2) TaxID=391735 RepID=A1WRE9_VEREI|nr:ABC transporter ATP-binding protein [Verminephrobacter eiseniae]ABM60206.1 ABC transporter related [Verminephrobacter eiseniae EF01-2]MCW5285696.1 ABC transporter ATP-binding protein [Verminephrobacter eiseniae]MCW5303996.1 ABC transporter ATP-binding protein [Verminephrobacter eiseniae]MCW8179736.1 ABC transporter ATP-binding protein [Verminephrobacter eiseniae]MCW8190363.1 ABC transporter ATP-binding protein [Verminephrobacter eiseniae]
MKPDAGAGSSAPLLAVQRVTLRYVSEGRTVTATENVSFDIRQGDRLVLLGPSGCGKSSLLKAIGGYLWPESGSIRLRGTPVRAPGPDRMMVFQEFDQLLPWKTVLGNVVFALESSGRWHGQAARARAAQAIASVKLGDFGDAYPHMLSGGMKQRVAIARGMAMEPEILLMDEPFAALDALTRVAMQDELLQLCNETRFTVVFVTHSIQEAIRIGSRILLLSPHPGRVKGEVTSDGKDRVHPSGQRLSEIIHESLFATAPGPQEAV